MSLRKTTILLVLCILIPLVIVSMIKVTTIARTQMPKTVVDLAVWEIDRPSKILGIRNHNQIERIFVDEDFVVQLHVDIGVYEKDALFLDPFYGNDGFCLTLQIEAFGNVSFPEYVNCTFHVSDMNSSVKISDLRGDLNCSVMNRYSNWFGGPGNDTVIILAANSTSCLVSHPVEWIFYDENSMEHTLNVTVECVYRNGALDKKVIFPLMLRVLYDAGNDFSSAELLAFGEYTRTLDQIDISDFFAMQLEETMKINVSIVPPDDTLLNLTLFDPNHVPVYQEASGSAFSLIYEVNMTGIWNIEVQLCRFGGHIDEGTYSIEIRNV